MHGNGKLEFSEQSEYYVGEFKHDRMDGEGEYQFKDQTKYQGNFKDGV